ncbi:MAG: nuclear transport factor 2 family protein [Opitutia bacterium]
MKTLLLSLLLGLGVATAAEPAADAVRAADDARVAAMLSPDKAVLDAVLSDDLRYAHSNGKVDTKASLTAALLGGDAKYLSYKYTERNFRFPAPDVAVMAGRLEVQAKVDGVAMTTGISYLAVWRLENGRWRFFAWQSCKIPPATPAK